MEPNMNQFQLASWTATYATGLTIITCQLTMSAIQNICADKHADHMLDVLIMSMLML